MKKSLAKTASKNKAKKIKAAPTAAEQFAKLWKQVQKEKASIAEALKQQANLVAQFNAEILPDEIALSRQLHIEAQHLLGFLSKKSLSFRQRELLIVWIHENIQVLRTRPFDTGLDTQDLIQQLRDYLEELTGESYDDEQVDEDLRKTSTDQADLFDEIEDDQKWSEEEAWDEEDPEVELERKQAKVESQAAEALFNASSVNKMFRQLAKIFHPDLEQDETQKAIKHEQMANLLKAREKQDVFTIFEMFCNQGGKGLPSFDDQELARLNELLKQQVRNVQREKAQALFENPLHGMIYERFYRKNPQFTFLSLKNHKQEVLNGIQSSKQLVASIYSLKALKQVLREKELEMEEALFREFERDLY